MRHASFHISKVEHDAWVSCMKDAANGHQIGDDLKGEIWDYLEVSAASIINATD